MSLLRDTGLSVATLLGYAIKIDFVRSNRSTGTAIALAQPRIQFGKACPGKTTRTPIRNRHTRTTEP
jgi:hypothetical protein